MKAKRQKEQAPAPETPQSTFSLIAFFEKHARLIALAAAILGSVRIAATYTVFSHTFDEPAHLGAGMEWLDRGIYTWEVQHPPLARVAGALGPYLLGLHTQDTPRTDYFAMFREGNAILYSGHQYDRNLAAARAGILIFFWLACLVVYEWGRRYFSPATGALAVLAFSFLPTILGHAGLATTDMASAATLGAAFLTGMIWIEHPTARRAAMFGVCTGLAVVSKFSSLGFFPVAVALALAFHLATERPALATLAREIRLRLPTFALAVLVGALVIWASYRFSFGKVHFAELSLPAPELYRGISDVLKHNQSGHDSYFLGQRTLKGSWYFFPTVLAIKTPIGFLILVAAWIALAVRRSVSFRNAAPVVAFTAAILLLGILSTINIGIRHILPIHIGLALLAGIAAAHLMATAPTHKLAAATLAVATLWFAGSSLLHHPDYLAYFNEFAGSEPERIVVDSDLDWGQDSKRLAKRLRELGAKEATFATYQLAEFEREHGFPRLNKQLDVLHPNPGWNAVGVTYWKERRLGLEGRYPNLTIWPDRLPPNERIGKSILLWYFPNDGKLY